MKLVCDHIAVDRGGEAILRDVSFSVSSGEALIVSGANGAGKSTLLRALAGLLPLAEGRTSNHIRLEERPAGLGYLPLAELTHYLGHENAMKPALTVEENLNFWRDELGGDGAELDEALDLVELDGVQNLPYGHLSTGQRRRVSICRLLMSERPLWLLDEPTSGLDKASENRFAEIMQDQLEAGGIIVAATHLPLGLNSPQTLEIKPLALDSGAFD
ncbi:MAG: heme ABC exporter ATP-binding protein CcmA [Pseudomonadota bacterium]